MAIAAENAGLAPADGAYERGDCAAATRLYAEVLEDPAIQPEARLSALFRSSQCHLNLGNHREARSGFQQYLRAVPGNVEARARYVQALHRLQRYQAALRVIDETGNPGDWKADLLYWKGSARYGLKEFSQARSAFEECVNASPEGYWTRRACQAAIADIDSMKGDPFFSVRGGIGWVYDGNVSSSTSQFTKLGGPGMPRPGLATVVDASQVIRDRAYLARAGMDFNWVRGSSFRLTSPLDVSLIQYAQQKSFSVTYGTAAVKATYFASDRWAPAATVTYSDTQYNFVGYSKSVTITPSATYYASMSSSCDFAIDFTRTFFGPRSTSLGGRTSLRQYSYTQSSSLDLSISRTLGEKALIEGTPPNPPSVTSGTVASRYWSVGVTGSLRWEVFWSVSLAPSLSATLSLFDTENLPLANPPPAAPPPAPPSRKDIQLIPAVTVSSPLVVDSVTISLTLQYTQNSSYGFQGLPDSTTGQLANQSYTRPYAALELAFWL